MGNEYVLGILTLAGINLMTVLGLSLLTDLQELFSFGHAGLYGNRRLCYGADDGKIFIGLSYRLFWQADLQLHWSVCIG